MFLAQVTPDNLTPAMVKAARALLDLTQSELAEGCGFGVATLRNFERDEHVSRESVDAIMRALTDRGIEFMNGGRPGVRLVA